MKKHLYVICGWLIFSVAGCTAPTPALVCHQDSDCDDQNPCTLEICNQEKNRCENKIMPMSGQEGPVGDSSCSNGSDDDCDGKIDSDDADCLGWQSVTAGGKHSCGVTADGMPFCWGWDKEGQLGDGQTLKGSTSPVAVDITSIPESIGFVQLTAGQYHTCGLSREGRAYCWGENQYGQLGDGSKTQNSPSPVAVDTSSISGAKTFVQLTAGGRHTCGLTADGLATCWGENLHGQLGNGDESQNSQSPVIVDTTHISGAKTFAQLTAGRYHTCGVTTDGLAICWGSDWDGQLGNGEDFQNAQRPVEVDTSSISGAKTFVHLTAGESHTCGVTTERAAYCWGSDNHGKLGDGGYHHNAQSPIAVDTSSILSGSKKFARLTAGKSHTCGLTTDGVAFCWGSNWNGQLGNGGEHKYSHRPMPVDTSSILGAKTFVQLSAGEEHTCGQTTDLVATCWGSDAYNQLGDGGASSVSQTPKTVDISGLADGERVFVQLTAGDKHTCGLNNHSLAFCWGSDREGKLGNGGESQSSQSPVAVDTSSIPGAKTFAQLAAGDHHTCGVATDGVAICWGDDFFGQLGDGDKSQSSQFPVAVNTQSLPDSTSFFQLATGGQHTCGLTTDGVATCWGDNFFGQLGNGDSCRGSTSSQRRKGNYPDSHSPREENDDDCWNSQSPVAVDTSSISGAKTFVQLTAGQRHTCGLTTDGVATCWGDDFFGQLGNGGNSWNSPRPMEVNTSSISGAKIFVQLTAGGDHTCGLTTDGVAFCWGSNHHGQLGNGGRSQDSQSPVEVDTTSISEAKTFVQLTAGQYHTCGVTIVGEALCWGSDYYGQLGVGDESRDTQSPQTVDTTSISAPKTFASLTAGRDHTCGSTTSGVPYCWGWGGLGQLGTGEDSKHSLVPVTVMGY